MSDGRPTPMRDVTRRRPVPLPRGIKERVRHWPPLRFAWTEYRRRQVHHEYESRREHYHRLAERRGISYLEEEVIRSARARLRARGYTPVVRRPGDVHTFACIPQYGWHRHLLPDLRELGPVTLFDYEALGYHYADFIRRGASAARLLDAMSARILPALRQAHAERPVDWVFYYGGGQDVSPVVVRQITELLGVPVVNMSLDDKQGWAGASSGPWRTGAVDITSAFDLYLTSARVACEWHLVEGGRPLYLPEGFDASAHEPRTGLQEIPVAFVGAAYGFRVPTVDFLRRHGVEVHTFGAGWPGSGWVDDVVDVFNRSCINLGMGGIEYSEALTNVKGRDFEIPGAGGGMYLTSFNPDLSQHFVVSEEIACYRNRDEMLELVRWYLKRPEEGAAMAARARERCLREHRWKHRYEKLLTALQVMA